MSSPSAGSGFTAIVIIKLPNAPGFVSSGDDTGAGANYHLCFANGSPSDCSAISGIANSGTTISSFSVDQDGTPRPQGSGWSIGAYEEHP